MRMQPVIMVAALLAASAIANAQKSAPAVTDASFRTAGGDLIVRQEIVLDVPLEAAWAALTTPQGLARWLKVHAWTDVRVGGYLEMGAGKAAGDPRNTRQRILAVVPRHLLVYQLEHPSSEAPPFPHAELLPHVVQLVELNAIAPGRTRWTQSVIGCRASDGSAAICDFYRAGNPDYLRELALALKPPVAPP